MKMPFGRSNGNAAVEGAMKSPRRKVSSTSNSINNVNSGKSLKGRLGRSSDHRKSRSSSINTQSNAQSEGAGQHLAIPGPPLLSPTSKTPVLSNQKKRNKSLRSRNSSHHGSNHSNSNGNGIHMSNHMSNHSSNHGKKKKKKRSSATTNTTTNTKTKTKILGVSLNASKHKKGSGRKDDLGLSQSYHASPAASTTSISLSSSSSSSDNDEEDDDDTSVSISLDEEMGQATPAAPPTAQTTARRHTNKQRSSDATDAAVLASMGTHRPGRLQQQYDDTDDVMEDCMSPSQMPARLRSGSVSRPSNPRHSLPPMMPQRHGSHSNHNSYHRSQQQPHQQHSQPQQQSQHKQQQHKQNNISDHRRQQYRQPRRNSIEYYQKKQFDGSGYGNHQAYRMGGANPSANNSRRPRRGSLTMELGDDTNFDVWFKSSFTSEASSITMLTTDPWEDDTFTIQMPKPTSFNTKSSNRKLAAMNTGSNQRDAMPPTAPQRPQHSYHSRSMHSTQGGSSTIYTMSPVRSYGRHAEIMESPRTSSHHRRSVRSRSTSLDCIPDDEDDYKLSRDLPSDIVCPAEDEDDDTILNTNHTRTAYSPHTEGRSIHTAVTIATYENETPQLPPAPLIEPSMQEASKKPKKTAANKKKTRKSTKQRTKTKSKLNDDNDVPAPKSTSTNSTTTETLNDSNNFSFEEGDFALSTPTSTKRRSKSRRRSKSKKKMTRDRKKSPSDDATPTTNNKTKKLRGRSSSKRRKERAPACRRNEVSS